MLLERNTLTGHPLSAPRFIGNSPEIQGVGGRKLNGLSKKLGGFAGDFVDNLCVIGNQFHSDSAGPDAGGIANSRFYSHVLLVIDSEFA